MRIPGKRGPECQLTMPGCYGNGPLPHYFVASTGSGAVPK